GRGFAVVADEVRKLAEKTVKATQEIAQVVTSIQEESRGAVSVMMGGQQTVARASALGKHAEETIHSVESQVSEATRQTHLIAVATEELSSTIQHLASNIDEIAQGSGQNTMAGEEIARTAESLARKADDLKTLTERFRI
ncbi:MAG: hypothetical protein HGA98_04240, partial [Deltaproteobacteria bacterium]|nr:hypothetical protein [Deltaproteobacteria bacterium]